MTCVLYILFFKFLEFNKYCVLLFLHYPTIKCNTFLWHLRCSSHLFLVWCKILQILAEVFLQQFQASHPLMRDKRLGPGRGFGQQQGIHIWSPSLLLLFLCWRPLFFHSVETDTFSFLDYVKCSAIFILKLHGLGRLR